MSLNPVPPDSHIVDSTGRLLLQWQAWMEAVGFWLGPVGLSGTTADRPTNNNRHPLYIGQGYFDTTLGFPVYVKSINPTVWVDGSGVTR